MALQHLRSSTADKRPTPAAMADGQVAVNTNLASPGLFFKDSNGDLVKVGPVHVGTTAPNATPGAGGQAGNSVGEQWLDTSSSRYVFKIWDGTAWRTEDGEFVNSSGDTMTGALGIIAGSAASPSLFISGDPNTGIYSPGADQLAISTNGTGRLFVDSSGNVGVGTSSPQSTLDIFQIGGVTSAPNTVADHLVLRGFSDSGMTFLTNTTGQCNIFFGDSDNQTIGRIQYLNDVDAMRFTANGSERLRITSAGLVGIGTSSPSKRFTVASNSQYDGVLVTNTSQSIAELIGFGATNDNGALILRNSGTANIQILASGLSYFNGGNVGIGTSSPSSLLDLNGGYASISNNSDDYRLRWRRTDGSFTGGLSVDGFYKLSFKLADASGTTQDRLVIDSLGRVGIGTTSPGYKLDVAPDSAGAAFRLRGGSGGTSVAQFTDATASAQWGTITTNSSSLNLAHSSTLQLSTASSERARIDSSGRLLVGTSSAYSFTNTYGTSISASVQAAGSDLHASQLLAHFANGLNANRTGSLAFARSQGAPGVFTAVSNGVKLGEVSFHGADGTSFVLGAAINAVVDGAVSTGDMPCRLVFSTTADGAASPTERMRISQNGVVTVKNGAVAEIGTLTDSATINPNFSANCNSTVTLGGNRTLANPTNQVAGQSGSIFVVQDGTGSRTLAYGVDWEFAGGTAPTLSTAANAVDRIDYIVRASGSIHAVLTKALS